MPRKWAPWILRYMETPLKLQAKIKISSKLSYIMHDIWDVKLKSSLSLPLLFALHSSILSVHSINKLARVHECMGFYA